MQTDIKYEAKGSCMGHECNVCGRSLYVGKWWHALFITIPLMIVYIIIMGIIVWDNNQASKRIDPPYCYTEKLLKDNVAQRTFVACPK